MQSIETYAQGTIVIRDSKLGDDPQTGGPSISLNGGKVTLINSPRPKSISVRGGGEVTVENSGAFSADSIRVESGSNVVVDGVGL